MQQLGRGLRKLKERNTTVIDFIGNYKYSYTYSLFGDASYNKDRLRKLLSAGSSHTRSLPQSFEKIAKERIFASIDSANMNTKKVLLEDFKLLKFRLGRPPLMMDFIKHNSRDPFQYVDYSGSLLAFTITTDEAISVDQKQLKLLAYLSKHVCNGVRLEESVILEALLSDGSAKFNNIIDKIERLAGILTNEDVIKSAIHNLDLNFVTESSGNKNYGF